MEAISEISAIIDEMLGLLPRERDYNATFERVSRLLMEKHSYSVSGLDLRFRFTLFMQEEFDKLPREKWRINDSSWLAAIELKAKDKLLKWIEQEIT
jgi:hypothetical protein